MFDKGRELIKKNDGPEIVNLSREAKKHMNILFDLSENLITSNFPKAREIILNNKLLDFEKFYDIDDYEFEIVAIFSTMRPLPSYGLYINTACNSILHENYMLFHLTIKMIFREMSLLHRVFSDDVAAINAVLVVMSLKLDRTTYRYMNWDFEFYYKECISNYYPIGNCIKTKYDFVYLNKSIYEEKYFDEDFLSKELNEYCGIGALKSFVYEADNYINKIGNASKSPAMWKELYMALLTNFASGTHSWSKQFSKDMLKIIIGYSKCFDSESVINYSMEMESFILQILISMQAVTLAKTGTFASGIDQERYFSQFVIFLINLYYVFPFDKVLELAEQMANKHLSNGIVQSICDEIIEQILSIKSKKNESKSFNLSVTSPTTQIISAEISEQSDFPKFTKIQLGIDMIDSYNIDVEIKFYDKDRNPVCNDKPYVLTFEEDNSEPNHYVYETIILEGSLIQYVEAQILRKKKTPLLVNDMNNQHKQPDRSVQRLDSSNMETDVREETYADKDSDSVWWLMLGCMLSVLGIFIWFFIKDTKPKMARSLCAGGVINIIINLLQLLVKAG